MRKYLLAALVALLALPVGAQTPQGAPQGASQGTAQPVAPAAPSVARPAAPAAAPAAKPTAARPAAKALPATKVDVNAATAAQLEALPGIGPARSKAIVANRPYAELGDLVKKKALPQGVFDKVAPGLALANINTSSAAELEKTLPGIGDVRAKAIVAGRPYAAPQDLVGKNVLTQPQLDKIKDVIAF